MLLQSNLSNATISPRIVLYHRPDLDQIVPINQVFDLPDCRPESPPIVSPFLTQMVKRKSKSLSLSGQLAMSMYQ